MGLGKPFDVAGEDGRFDSGNESTERREISIGPTRRGGSWERDGRRSWTRVWFTETEGEGGAGERRDPRRRGEKVGTS